MNEGTKPSSLVSCSGACGEYEDKEGKMGKKIETERNFQVLNANRANDLKRTWVI